MIVGHGSGSFGHVTAAQHQVHLGARSDEQVEGVAATQAHAHRLHRLVAETMWKAGCRPFSFAPSSSVVATGGDAQKIDARPIAAALELGLVPVVFGDVVMDNEWGASICSTERAFEMVISALRSLGWGVSRVIWAGETEGIYDREGVTIPRIDSGNVDDITASLEGASGEDVTGGIRLRLETAWRLAEDGVESLIINGLEPEILAGALAGRDVPATCVSGA